jgi:hypothetical protein
MWSTVGSHEVNGEFAVLGARMGTWMTNCTDWDYVQVRDFEVLREIYANNVSKYESDADGLVDKVKDLGNRIKYELGLHWPYLSPERSKYTFDLYNETLNLNRTYYRDSDDL